jgi:hypothetical protein
MAAHDHGLDQGLSIRGPGEDVVGPVFLPLYFVISILLTPMIESPGALTRNPLTVIKPL